ncbi:MAG: hypothetical protein RL532_752, partial [Actinomycetota bacterium]
LNLDRQVRGFMAPVLKDLALRRCVRECGAIMVAEPCEERQLLAAHEHVHRIDLYDSKLFDECNDVAR